MWEAESCDVKVLTYFRGKVCQIVTLCDVILTVGLPPQSLHLGLNTVGPDVSPVTDCKCLMAGLTVM